MIYVIIGAIFIVAVLLTLVVLVQNSKGGGLASNVGISNQVMGVQRSSENIEKITWWLVGILAALCIASGFFFNTKLGTTNTRSTEYEPLKTQYDMPENPQMDPSLQTQPQGGQPGGGQPGGGQQQPPAGQ